MNENKLVGYQVKRDLAIKKMQQMEEAQRAKVLSSVLGLAGTVIGFYAGGPGGAAKGGM